MRLTYDLWSDTCDLYDRIVAFYGVPLWWAIEPDLVLYHDPGCDLYGWHTLDEIGVNFATCENWTDVVGTLIHEYAHHLQNPDHWDEDAYETEADQVTMRDLHLFLDPKVA